MVDTGKRGDCPTRQLKRYKIHALGGPGDKPEADLGDAYKPPQLEQETEKPPERKA